MVILVLAENSEEGAVVSNEIQALLGSLKIGVNRGDELKAHEYTDEEHATLLHRLRGRDVDLIFRRLRAKAQPKEG